MQDLKVISLRNKEWSCQKCGKCCIGWNIGLGKKEYSNLKNAFAGNNETERINGIKKSSQKQFDYVMSLDPSTGRCQFLMENNECYIHKNYGEKYLPMVCKTYPRNYTKYKNVVYEGMSLSCDSYAKGIQKPGNVPFVEDIVNGDAFKQKIVNDLPDDIVTFIKFNLTPHIINILRDGQYVLHEKLCIIAFLYNDALETYKKYNSFPYSYKANKIADSISAVVSACEKGEFKTILAQVEGDRRLELNFLVNSLKGRENILLALSSEGINNFDKLAASSDMYHDYTEMVVKNKSVLDKYDDILTNAIIHAFFNSDSIKPTFSDSFQKIVVYYLALRFLIVMEENITEDVVLNYIKACYRRIFQASQLNLQIESLGNAYIASYYHMLTL